MKDIKLTPAQRRKMENDELLDRWKKNECKPVVSREAMAFPPRPVIKKDHALMKQLYDGEPKPCPTSTDDNDPSNDSLASRGKKQKATLTVL